MRGVTLAVCLQFWVTNLAADLRMFSNLSIYFCLKGSQTVEEYSNDDLTKEKYRQSPLV